MFSFFLGFCSCRDFCIKAPDYVGECSPGREIITDITVFYNAFATEYGNTLEILNTPNSIVAIDMQQFHTKTVSLIGSPTSKIAIDNPMDVYHSHIGLHNLTARFDNTRYDPLFIYVTEFENVTFENAENIYINTEQLISDAYSIQFFNNISVDYFNLDIKGQGYMPKRSTTITTNDFELSTVFNLVSDTEISVSRTNMNITTEGFTYYINVGETSSVGVINDNNVKLTVSSIPGQVINSEKYQFSLVNSSIRAIYNKFNEGPMINTSGISTVELEDNAVFLNVKDGVTTLNAPKGTSRGSTFSVADNAILYLQDCTTPYQAMNVQMTGTAQILTKGNAILQQNGIFNVSQTKHPAQIGENVILSVTNPRSMKFVDAEFTIDTIQMNDNQDLFVEFTTNIHDGVLIKKGLESFVNNFKWAKEIMPTNDEADNLMKGSYYGICSSVNFCDNVTTKLVDSQVHGFANIDNMVDFKCGKVESQEKYCASVQLKQRPMDVYPQYCFTDNSSLCIQPFISLPRTGQINMSKIVPKTAKLITIDSELDFNSIISFSGIENANVYCVGNKLIKFDFSDTNFYNVTLDAKNILVSGKGKSKYLSTTKNVENMTGKAYVDSDNVVLSYTTIDYLSGFKAAKVDLNEDAVVIFNEDGWTIDNYTYHILLENRPDLTFALPFWSTLPIHASKNESAKTVYEFPIQNPVGDLRVELDDTWNDFNASDLFAKNKKDFIMIVTKSENIPFPVTSYNEFAITSKLDEVKFEPGNISNTKLVFDQGNVSTILHDIVISGNSSVTKKKVNGPVHLVNSVIMENDSSVKLSDLLVSNLTVRDSSRVNITGNATSITLILADRNAPFVSVTNCGNIHIDWSAFAVYHDSEFVVSEGNFTNITLHPTNVLHEKSEIMTIHASVKYENGVLSIVFEKKVPLKLIIFSSVAGGFVVIVFLLIAVLVFKKKKEKEVRNIIPSSMASAPLLTESVQ